MKKLLKNKNFYLVLALLVVIAGLLIASQVIDFSPKTLPQISITATPVPVATAAPEATEAPAADATAEPAADATAEPAADAATETVLEEVPLGYVLVQANGDGGWIPLPTTEEPLYVTIGREGDETIKNTLRLWQTGFAMDSSTCDNQDCVQQGEVTFENMGGRVLMHMVLCLPHNVSVELYSTEDIIAMMQQAQQQQ